MTAARDVDEGQRDGVITDRSGIGSKGSACVTMASVLLSAVITERSGIGGKCSECITMASVLLTGAITERSGFGNRGSECITTDSVLLTGVITERSGFGNRGSECITTDSVLLGIPQDRDVMFASLQVLEDATIESEIATAENQPSWPVPTTTPNSQPASFEASDPMYFIFTNSPRVKARYPGPGDGISANTSSSESRVLLLRDAPNADLSGSAEIAASESQPFSPDAKEQPKHQP